MQHNATKSVDYFPLFYQSNLYNINFVKGKKAVKKLKQKQQKQKQRWKQQQKFTRICTRVSLDGQLQSSYFIIVHLIVRLYSSFWWLNIFIFIFKYFCIVIKMGGYLVPRLNNQIILRIFVYSFGRQIGLFLAPYFLPNN